MFALPVATKLTAKLIVSISLHLEFPETHPPQTADSASDKILRNNGQR